MAMTFLTPSSSTTLRDIPRDAAFPAGSARSGRKMSFPRRIPCKAAATAPSVMTLRRSGSLYEVLQLTANSSPAEIKTAYRSLAKMYHPDSSSRSGSSNGGADFMAIHNAYATLSDPTARMRYDVSLRVGSGMRRAGYGPGFYPTRRWETDQCW